MIPNTPFVLPKLTRWQHNNMLHYAEQALLAQQHIVNNTHQGILHYVLQKKRRPVRFKHYPSNDRMDLNTGAQYFYHCHRENKRSCEHGHFHCFIRYKQIPKRIKPKPLIDWDKHIHNPMTHLVAIAMDRYSQPIRLFTVNRWITSEIWYDALHAPYLLKRFTMTLNDDPYWKPVDQWVEAILKLFSPQIIWLQQQRDYVMQDYQLKNPNTNVYDDESLQEISEININLKQQIEWILTAKS